MAPDNTIQYNTIQYNTNSLKNNTNTKVTSDISQDIFIKKSKTLATNKDISFNGFFGRFFGRTNHSPIITENIGGIYKDTSIWDGFEPLLETARDNKIFDDVVDYGERYWYCFSRKIDSNVIKDILYLKNNETKCAIIYRIQTPMNEFANIEEPLTATIGSKTWDRKGNLIEVLESEFETLLNYKNYEPLKNGNVKRTCILKVENGNIRDNECCLFNGPGENDSYWYYNGDRITTEILNKDGKIIASYAKVQDIGVDGIQEVNGNEQYMVQLSDNKFIILDRDGSICFEKPGKIKLLDGTEINVTEQKGEYYTTDKNFLKMYKEKYGLDVRVL